MNDPFDQLREHLVTAARGRPARRRRRGLLAMLGASLVLSGGVATALVTSDEPSRPASGTLPVSGDRYSVELRPDFTTGAIGWCASLSVRHGRTSRSFGSGCGPAPSPERAHVAGLGMGNPNGGLYGFVVTERVATVVLPDGRRIAPRSDRTVPAPWKLVVASYRELPGIPVQYLDAQGAALPDTDPPGSWAAGAHRLPVRDVDAKDPPQRPCAIRTDRPDRFRPVSATLLTRFPSEPPRVAEPALLSCATTVFYRGRTRLRAAVLVDPADRAKPAALLPGMRAEPASGAVVATGALVSARRAGPGWLAVFGGNASQREALLRSLRASP